MKKMNNLFLFTHILGTHHTVWNKLLLSKNMRIAVHRIILRLIAYTFIILWYWIIWNNKINVWWFDIFLFNMSNYDVTILWYENILILKYQNIMIIMIIRMLWYYDIRMLCYCDIMILEYYDVRILWCYDIRILWYYDIRILCY